MPIRSLSMPFFTTKKPEEINAERRRKFVVPPPPPPPPQKPSRSLENEFSDVSPSPSYQKLQRSESAPIKTARGLGSMLMNLQHAKKCGSCGGFK